MCYGLSMVWPANYHKLLYPQTVSYSELDVHVSAPTLEETFLWVRLPRTLLYSFPTIPLRPWTSFPARAIG
jgi:hypothetical protein